MHQLECSMPQSALCGCSVCTSAPLSSCKHGLLAPSKLMRGRDDGRQQANTPPLHRGLEPVAHCVLVQEHQAEELQQAIARAKGTVWELLCFGPHNVELLSEATRQLAPLGVQLLHAAHSHAARPTKGVAKGGEVAAQTEQCSCIFIDKPGKRPSADEVAEFTKKVLHVLMTTYGSKDEANFTVRPVDSKELQELAAIASVTSQAEVPGVGSFTKPRSASFARRTGKATNAITMNLKEIPTSPGGQRRPSEVGRRPSRASFGPAAAADQPMQFLEC
uniref:Uncharacterized protein n=1 Tax=Haptolina ericina TaxID=156174 RepID=A0A7S3ETI7_9EUKA|mmetsp:Transcript_22646/g.51210  ORF Transcript_22646/g.51210 Transcript_22646/m.51210 type:complete len:276 (+) Transcript_22646:153-980(+)